MNGRWLIEKENKEKMLYKIQAYFIGFCYDAINFLFKSIALVLWPRKIQSSPQKICIYRVGNIGDIVCIIPAIIAIRKSYPDAHITLLTSPGKKGHPGAKELIDNVWFINRLWVYYSDEISSFNGIYQLVKNLRSESFDLLIYLPQELIVLKILARSLIFIKLCKTKKAIGFELGTIKIWGRAQSKFYQFENEVDRLINLLKRWNIPVSGKVEYNLPIPKNIQESATKIIKDSKIKAKRIFGIMPGASYKDNQWSVDNFAEIGKFILKKYKNCQIIILGGPGDKEKGEYMKNKIVDSTVINLCGKTSLLETAFVINKLTLLVSNNTGLMHIAALAGIRVVAIFSPAELNGKWSPYGNNSKVIINRDVAECDGYYYKKTLNCHERINDISVKEVENEIINFIK